jgi:hypothetical protein
MERCEHEGRAFLKPCPVCALVQVATERDEARALLADSPTAAARQVAAIGRELNQVKLVLAACKTAKEEDYERFQRELAEARAEVKRLRDYDTQQWRRGVDEELAKSREMFEPGLVKSMRKERDEARAVADQAKDTIAVLKEQLDELRSALKRAQDYGEGPTWGTHRESLVDTAKRQREAAALTAESWGRRQELIAEDKERETIWASAEMHRAEAIMARRIAQAIRGMPLVTGDDK